MDVSDRRVPYSVKPLFEEDLSSTEDPLKQFISWFEAADRSSDRDREPNAACLSTCTPEGVPSSRMVLIKKFDERGFTFFTNYSSRKGREINSNPKACLLFYWPSLHRQVRIEGDVSKVSEAESEAYFKSRPLPSQISATISKQSSEIISRQELQESCKKLELSLSGEKSLPKPVEWGGYTVKPKMYEFWQGQTNRLHDRITFTRLSDDTWVMKRLSP